jgi:hypothetical protein
MTDTAIEIPGYVTVVEPAPGLPVRDLAQAAATLLSANADLPAPQYLAVSAVGQEIELQFSSDPSTFRAMAQWAERFGGTVTGQPGANKDGTPYVRCEVHFTADALAVRAYAYIQAGKAT